MEKNSQSSGGPATMNQMVVVHTGGPGGNSDVKMTSEASQMKEMTTNAMARQDDVTDPMSTDESWMQFIDWEVLPDITKLDDQGSKTEVTFEAMI
ncbi:unnamed protein product [Calypogeia fissa]